MPFYSPYSRVDLSLSRFPSRDGRRRPGRPFNHRLQQVRLEHRQYRSTETRSLTRPWSNGPHRLMRLWRTWWSNPADATGPIPAPLPQKISLSIQKVSPKSVHSYPQRQPVKTYFSYRQFKITEIHGFMSPGFVIRITLKKHSTCPPRIGCWSGIFHRYPSASYSVHKPTDRQTNHNRRMTFSSSCRQ